MTGSREYRIRCPDQIRALSTPARQEVIDAILSLGPSTVAEIARALGRPADSLYHHTRILKRVGLVVPVETRRRGRRDEVIYDVPGRPMRIDYDLADRKVSEGIVEAIGAMLRITQRDFSEAVATATAAVDGPYRALWGARVKGWISKGQLREVNRHLQGICRLMLSTDRRRGTSLHSLTFVITPIEPSTRGETKKG